MALMSNANTFVPQMNENESALFEKVEISGDVLVLPEINTQDLLGIVNAVAHNVGINNSFCRELRELERPRAVKQLARILNREIFMVDFSAIVDSKLGQTKRI